MKLRVGFLFLFFYNFFQVCANKWLGLERMSVSFGTDCPRLKGSHKKYLYGPGSILDAHGENEQVIIPDLIECVAVYKRLTLMLLRS